MIQTLVATLMWALVASLLIFRRKRADRSITYAAITIAIAMTLNVDAIYSAVDPLLGGTNIATLIADALLMTGLFFLGRGVMKTGEYRPRLVRAAVSIPVLLVSLLAITVTFLFIDRGTTTTQFMSDLGAQPAAAVYSIINFTYGGIVIATDAGPRRPAVPAQHRHPAPPRRAADPGLGVRRRALPRRDRHGHRPRHRPTRPHARRPAHLRSALAAHLPVPLRRVRRPARRPPRSALRAPAERTAALAAQLEPLWHRATRVRPGLSQADPLAASSDDPEGRLHREIVEIRDAMIDPRITFDISRPTTATCSNAPRATSSDATRAVATTSPVPNVEERES